MLAQQPEENRLSPEDAQFLMQGSPATEFSKLETLRKRMINVESKLKVAQADLLEEGARISARESYRNSLTKAKQVAPLFFASVVILILACCLDAAFASWDRPDKGKSSSSEMASSDSHLAQMQPASADGARQVRPTRQEELRKREERDSLTKVQCLDKLIHDPGAALAAGCGQAAVAVSIRGPVAVASDAKAKSIAQASEVVSEWRFPGLLELRQSAVLESTLEALEKDQERSGRQKAWAAISVPVQVVSVFGVLVAIALLIAELARGAGFNWNPEQFVSERLTPKKDGSGDSRNSVSSASGGPLLMALLGTLPLLLIVALALMIVGWSSWRALAPPDLRQVVPLVDRTVLYPSAFPPAASAPVNVTVSAKQIDDNTEVLGRQLALLTKASEQSALAASASAAWLAKVQDAASSSAGVLNGVASTAKSVGDAAEKIQVAAHTVQQSASEVSSEAKKAAGHYTDAAKKMDESANATLTRIKSDEANLRSTQDYLLKFQKYVEESKWGHGP